MKATIYIETVNMRFNINGKKRRFFFSPLLAVFTDQIRLPIKTQKEEKLANLNTYAFTINQVPHVFEEHYFVGHQKALFDADLRKEIRETPI
jgi:hypothetical protein